MGLQVYIEAVLSQYINDQQQVSKLRVSWSGGGPDYQTEEILHEVRDMNSCFGKFKDYLIYPLSAWILSLE